MGAKKGTKKATMKVVNVDDSRKVAFHVVWTVNGESKEKSFETRRSLYAQVRQLNAVGIPIDSVVRIVTHSVNVERA